MNFPDDQRLQITLQSLTGIGKELAELTEINTNFRMKYADDPEKFYNSEQQINSLLQQLTELTQQHLPIIIQSQLSLPLTKLLSHPNTDLSITVISILYEILEEQPQEDRLFQIYFRWIIYLTENYTVQGIVGLLCRLDEENDMNEYDAGLKCLKLLQLFMNSTDTIYNILSEDKQFFSYLSNRILPNFVIKHKIIDDNKYLSSDLLVMLLNNSEKAQHLFSQFSGVEVLLQTISAYETNLPTNEDEKEFLNNLFSALSILLINHTLHQYSKMYHEMKGNYLMISFIKMKNQYSAQALKCMSNSLIGLGKEEEKQTVYGMINDGGLKYLMPVLRRKGLRGEDVDEQKAIDQSVLNILYAMARSSTGVLKDRLEYKLGQNRFQNLQRLLQLRNEYSQMVNWQQVNQQGQKESKTNLKYLDRLSQGLGVIQTIDKILLVLVDKYSKLKNKIANLFTIYTLKYQDLEKTIKDHYNYVGIKEEKTYVEMLLANNLLLLKKALDKQNAQAHQVKNQEKKGLKQKQQNSQ